MIATLNTYQCTPWQSRHVHDYSPSRIHKDVFLQQVLIHLQHVNFSDMTAVFRMLIAGMCVYKLLLLVLNFLEGEHLIRADQGHILHIPAIDEGAGR